MIDEEIQSLKYLYETQLKEADKEYRERCEEINKKLSLLRKECSHQNKTWNPDPSGNNDSFYSCDVCGTEGKRI